MIVLDAGVLIAHLDTSDARHSAATNLVAASGPEMLAMSPVSLAEAMVGPARKGSADRALALRMPDCCVLLAVSQPGAAVATFDDRLAGVAMSLGLRALPPRP
ncbi:MAG: type II toxin-antitoxin system VapC family toxin [Acidimicrobiales bacterium]